MKTITKMEKGWIAGLLAAVASSFCCIAPILALLGGAGGLASRFLWLEPLRPYLIALTIAVFALAWYQKLKTKKQVDCDCGVKKSFLQSNFFLGIVTIIAALLISFPFYSKLFYPQILQAKVVVVNKTDIQKAVFTIKGMSCESCNQHVNEELSKVKGTITYQTSYQNGNSTVTFHNSKTSLDSIATAINGMGYKVVSQSLINNQ